MSDLEVLDRDAPEIMGAWSRLARMEVNNGDPVCDNNGACWQYVSSTTKHHQFRHRCHPSTNERMMLHIDRTDI